MGMPASSVYRQHLLHKVVLVLVYDLQGRVYLPKRSAAKKAYPNMWAISASGHVQPAESFPDAALRTLREKLNIRLHTLKEIGYLAAAGPETAQAFIRLFSTGRISTPPSPNPDEICEGLYLDKEDMQAMIDHFDEMLTPALRWAYQKGYIFPLAAR